MRSVYNPAGNNNNNNNNNNYKNSSRPHTNHVVGMPGSGSHYSVMGRSQDPRSSMFGSSLNLNGKNIYLLSLFPYKT